jgi:GrpB-like predicted nucleotidyltransferase (UPF0157 family)
MLRLLKKLPTGHAAQRLCSTMPCSEPLPASRSVLGRFAPGTDRAPRAGAADGGRWSKQTRMKIVEVVEYDPSWPARFDDECTLLRRILGDVAISIHHIGSTAVPGLAAKPIIDILLEVAELAHLDAMNPEMVRLGYVPKGEFGISGRRYFPKGMENRTHQIHAFATGDVGLFRHLAFRDYLRRHPEVALEYGTLKRAIALSCSNDLSRYCDAKDAYVKKHEALAMNEERHNNKARIPARG